MDLLESINLTLRYLIAMSKNKDKQTKTKIKNAISKLIKVKKILLHKGE